MRKKGVEYTGITIVFLCHDDDGNFLLAKRSKNCRDEHGNWDCGGGGLEFNDNVEDTLKKEIQEEYCAKILKQEFLGYRDVHRSQKGIKSHWIALDFKVLVDRKSVQIGEPHKFEKLDWFKLYNLPSPLHSQLPGLLRKYKNKL